MIKPETRFSARLTGLFLQVEQQFRDDTVARYKLVAESEWKSWEKLLTGPEPEKKRTFGFGSVLDPPKYVRCKAGSYSPNWDMLVASFNRGDWEKNEAAAIRDANDSVDYAKQHFISKQSKKLANATKLRTDRPTIAGKLIYKVLIEGSLTLKYPNGDSFLIVMSMIVNHRYTRGYTSFYQFPARFCNVKMAGEFVKPARVSEKWMSEHFK